MENTTKKNNTLGLINGCNYKKMLVQYWLWGQWTVALHDLQPAQDLPCGQGRVALYDLKPAKIDPGVSQGLPDMIPSHTKIDFEVS